MIKIVGYIPIFQSTLPREERLTDANVQLYAKSISIHAPTRGATYSDSNANNACAISIHAPTRGATKVKKVLRRILKFQSTLPREERRGSGSNYSNHGRFQSTLPREERPEGWAENVTMIKFQSTLPREERPKRRLI